jgi:hypothetical protein
MKRALIRPQPDLFEDAGPAAAVPKDQRQSLVLLIQVMLTEIATTTPAALTKQESSDDEDHA